MKDEPVVECEADILSLVVRGDAAVLGGELDLLPRGAGCGEGQVGCTQRLILHVLDAHQTCRQRLYQCFTVYCICMYCPYGVCI